MRIYRWANDFTPDRTFATPGCDSKKTRTPYRTDSSASRPLSPPTRWRRDGRPADGRQVSMAQSCSKTRSSRSGDARTGRSTSRSSIGSKRSLKASSPGSSRPSSASVSFSLRVERLVRLYFPTSRTPPQPDQAGWKPRIASVLHGMRTSCSALIKCGGSCGETTCVECLSKPINDSCDNGGDPPYWHDALNPAGFRAQFRGDDHPQRGRGPAYPELLRAGTQRREIINVHRERRAIEAHGRIRAHRVAVHDDERMPQRCAPRRR